MPSRENGGPFWVGSQPLDLNVLEGDQWWDGTTLWERRSGAWTAITGQSALPPGTVVDLGVGGGTSVVQNVTAAPTTLANVPIPANTFSKIRIHAIGWVLGSPTSVLQIIQITTSVGGGPQRVWFAAAANQYIPWSLELILIQQAATTIAIQENAPGGVDDANTRVGLIWYNAEGIV